MANRLLGVAALPDLAETRRLATASRRATEVGWPTETEVLGFVHVLHGEAASTYRVGITPDGLALFGDLERPVVYAMPVDTCQAVLSPLLGFAGALDAAPPSPLGRTTALPGPYRGSPIILDTATIRARLNGGRPTQLPETERYLPEEQFFVRLPTGYSPRHPAGLLVWIDAGTAGAPPADFDAAADALGLVMIGAADAGNARLATDRYQLGLDAVATAARRFHIDTSRVYASGISGGGRITSGLVACFPDIFTGAVPIVGVNAYEPVPLGDGRFIVAGFLKPETARFRLLRERRIAAVSGPLDFNYREIVSAVRIFQRDGLDARLFEYEDMAHTLPTADRFTEAITWVDAPHAAANAAAAADADKQLGAYLLRFDELPIKSDTQRRLLERITVTAPWSPAAWRACELLGVVEPTGQTEAPTPDAPSAAQRPEDR
jgi:hypothetical protein